MSIYVRAPTYATPSEIALETLPSIWREELRLFPPTGLHIVENEMPSQVRLCHGRGSFDIAARPIQGMRGRDQEDIVITTLGLTRHAEVCTH